MLRYRRYRAFLVFAVFAVFGIYYAFSGDGSWQPSSLTAPSLDRFGFSGQRSKSDSTVSSGQTYQPDLGGERKPDPSKSNPDGTPLAAVNDDDHDMPRKNGATDKTGDKTGRPNAEKIKPSPEEKEKAKPKDKPADRPVSNPLDTNRGDSSSSSKGSSSSQNESPPKDSSPESHTPPSSSKNLRPEFDSIASHEGVPKTSADTAADAAPNVPGEASSAVKVLPPTPNGNLHWIRQQEHFPVKSIIPLPSGAAKTIAQIQFDKFPKESKDYKAARLEKLDTIRKVAKKNWDSYKEFAWMHDEFTPVSGSFNDPFGGWAATLVDALDTLYIMGLVDEFEEGVEAVKSIDFTTSVRDDIPLFETVIRYMGGMLGAYDVSGAKYPVLLNKSIELAEILMGAFDTPNRMPVTFYQWKPAFASQPHRAGSNVVMAELGTLSLEFTRLAQLTKEHKYYDAIDRITDAFVEYQTRETEGTTLPGLFPLNIDASGCMKPDPFAAAVAPKKQNQRPIKAAEPVIPGSAEKKDGISGKSDSAAASKPDDEDAALSDEKSPAAKPKNGDALSPLKSNKKAAGPSESHEYDTLTSPERAKALADAPEADSYDTAKAKSPGGAKKAAAVPESDVYGTSRASSPEALGKSAEAPEPQGFDTSKASSPGVAKNPSLQKRQALPIDDTKTGPASSKDPKEELDTKAGVGIPKEETPVHLAATKADAAPAQYDKAVPIPAAETTPDVSSHNPYNDPVAYLPDEVEICAPSNLTSGNKYGRDRYSLSGMADSTYEYFPKTYLLLGGLEEKYRGLHERAMDAATEKLLFRPHVPGSPDILISGDYDAWYSDTYDHSSKVMGDPIPETAHLACFAGGMYALGAKIFDRPDDLEIAAKLTEGCVWAYSVTKSGVMPEAFAVMPCKDREECEWDPKIYADAIDPQWEFRQAMYDNQLQAYNDRLEAEKAGSTVPPYTGEKDAVEHLGDDEELKGALLGKSGHNSNAPHPKNPQDISDNVHSPAPQRNPQKIGDDNDSPAPQRNPQKISDNAEPHRLVKRVYDENKMPTNANSEEEKDTVHILGSEHGDDDIKAGKPLDYKGAPSAQTAEGDTKAGKPVDYKGIPSAKEPVEAAPAGKPQQYVPGAMGNNVIQPPPANLFMNGPPSFGGGLMIGNTDGPPEPPLSHEDMVKQRVEMEGLSGGMTRIMQRKYILRPEAIESVWYMYRITGDPHWRKVGWQMFQAVNKATATEYGNSAIWDVTTEQSDPTDSQESFWMAETLKYYYLLFAEEDVISLDEWVLNTEAHPFKRPTPKKKLY